MNQPVITLDRVGKRYWKLEEGASLLRSILPFYRARRAALWALRDVELTVDHGEMLGVLGRNGSGKTTMLRLLCGVTSPTEGRVRVVGRVAPLISVGVGFHLEMTGRENVLVNGLLLGLTEGQVKERFDDVVAFAEMAEFIDTPVKYYSSGMFVRLGFSVAVHSDPEVLLVDEVLAVGDLTYQMRCIERMQALRERGCTIVFVSHAVNAVRSLCDRAVLLDHGRVEFDGPSEQAVARYHEILSLPGVDEEEAVRAGLVRRVVGGAKILDHQLVGPEGPGTYFARDVPLVYRFRARFEETVEHPLFGINVLGQDGRAAYGVHSPVGLRHRVFSAGEEAEVSIHLMNRLGGGTYRITCAVTSCDGREILASEQNGLLFFVEPVPNAYGSAELEGIVSVDGVKLLGGEPAQREAL